MIVGLGVGDHSYIFMVLFVGKKGTLHAMVALFGNSRLIHCLFRIVNFCILVEINDWFQGGIKKNV